MTPLAERNNSILDLPTEEAAEKKREAAFNSGYSWDGKQFEGLTSARKDLWSSLCHKAGFPLLSQCFDDVVLFTPLAKAIIFVCSTPKAELKQLRSQGMQSVLDTFEDWCDEKVPIRLESEAISLGIRILNDSSANQSEVLPAEGVEVKKP
jgi:hypothetical protein